MVNLLETFTFLWSGSHLREEWLLMCSKYVQGKNCQSNTLDIGLVMLSRCMSLTHFKLWKQCSSIIHILICCWGLNIVKDQIQSGFGQCDFILSILLDSSFSSSVNIAIAVNASDQTGLDQNCSVWHNVRQHNLHQLFTDESLLSTGVVQQHCVYISWL